MQRTALFNNYFLECRVGLLVLQFRGCGYRKVSMMIFITDICTQSISWLEKKAAVISGQPEFKWKKVVPSHDQ